MSTGAPSRLCAEPLDPGALLAAVAGPGRGGIALFVGAVRDHAEGRAVVALEYSAYAELAEHELEQLEVAALARFGAVVRVAHRIGRLEVGEAAVVIAAAHAHRAPAFDACRWTIETLKRRVPIWKRECFADGTRSWVQPAAPDDAAPSAIRPIDAARGR